MRRAEETVSPPAGRRDLAPVLGAMGITAAVVWAGGAIGAIVAAATQLSAETGRFVLVGTCLTVPWAGAICAARSRSGWVGLWASAAAGDAGGLAILAVAWLLSGSAPSWGVGGYAGLYVALAGLAILSWAAGAMQSTAWRRVLPALGVALGGAVVVAAFALGVSRGLWPRIATVAALGVATAWVCLMAPPAAVGTGETAPRRWSRWWSAVGGALTVAGGSLAGLAGVWVLAGGGSRPQALELPLMAWLRVAAVLGAVSLAAGTFVALARRAVVRMWLAVLASVLLLAASAVPLWIEGPMQRWGLLRNPVAIESAFRGCPFYGVTAAVSRETQFVWHEWGWMYTRGTRIGQDMPAPIPEWSAGPATYLCVAAVLAAVALARWLGGKWRRGRHGGPVAPTDASADP